MDWLNSINWKDYGIVGVLLAACLYVAQRVIRWGLVVLFGGFEKPADGKGIIKRVVDEHMATLASTREETKQQTAILKDLLVVKSNLSDSLQKMISDESPVSNMALECAALHAIAALESLCKRVEASDALPFLEKAKTILENKLSGGHK